MANRQEWTAPTPLPTRSSPPPAAETEEPLLPWDLPGADPTWGSVPQANPPPQQAAPAPTRWQGTANPATEAPPWGGAPSQPHYPAAPAPVSSGFQLPPEFSLPPARPDATPSGYSSPAGSAKPGITLPFIFAMVFSIGLVTAAVFFIYKAINPAPTVKRPGIDPNTVAQVDFPPTTPNPAPGSPTDATNPDPATLPPVPPPEAGTITIPAEPLPGVPDAGGNSLLIPPPTLPLPSVDPDISNTPEETTPLLPGDGNATETIMPAKPVEEPEAPAEGTIDPANAANGDSEAAKIGVENFREAATVLDKFLKAATWQERANYSLQGKLLSGYMEKFYSTNPDGPVNTLMPPRQTLVAETPEDKLELQLFSVVIKDNPVPIPVSVEKTKEGGYLVDWVSFAQFKDNTLDAFFKNPSLPPAYFFFTLRRVHYPFDDIPDLDNKLAYRLDNHNPSGDYKYAFVDKTSPQTKDLDEKFGWNLERPATVVGELAWNSTGDRPFVEIRVITQENWRTDDFVSKTLRLTR